MTKPCLLDANYVLRWFLNDVPVQAVVVQELLDLSSEESLHIDRVSMAEVTYVLRSMGYTNMQITTVLREFTCYPSVVRLADDVNTTLDIYNTTTLDFEDCYIVAACKVNGYKPATFDIKLLRTFDAIGL